MRNFRGKFGRLMEFWLAWGCDFFICLSGWDQNQYEYQGRGTEGQRESDVVMSAVEEPVEELVSPNTEQHLSWVFDCCQELQTGRQHLQQQHSDIEKVRHSGYFLVKRRCRRCQSRVQLSPILLYFGPKCCEGVEVLKFLMSKQKMHLGLDHERMDGLQEHLRVVSNRANSQTAHGNQEKQQILIPKADPQATIIPNPPKRVIKIILFLFLHRPNSPNILHNSLPLALNQAARIQGRRQRRNITDTHIGNGRVISTFVAYFRLQIELELPYPAREILNLGLFFLYLLLQFCHVFFVTCPTVLLSNSFYFFRYLFLLLSQTGIQAFLVVLIPARHFLNLLLLLIPSAMQFEILRVRTLRDGTGTSFLFLIRHFELSIKARARQLNLLLFIHFSQDEEYIQGIFVSDIDGRRRGK